MALLRSARALAVIAIFAMILAVAAPFSIATEMVGHADQSHAAASLPGTMDCETCPKAMAPGGCMQMTCQMVVPASEYIHLIVTAAIRYAPAAVIAPAEWHIVPPVSPG
jgi:hypothetical protein